MDIRKVKKLIEMLEQSRIAEIEIHEGEASVRISKVSSISPSGEHTDHTNIVSTDPKSNTT